MVRDTLFIVGWLACAVLVCGIFTADSQAKSHYPGEKFREDLGFGLAFGLLFGPFGLAVLFFVTGFAQHGLVYRRPKSGKVKNVTEV
ncbi:MAG: hypothetical protein KGI50_06125 [Patescibacteria group bacterium]|nr:hypothetical protein [Patescibacteria group bacterium]MDE2439081.1 hypothetical protein [Patescibacteria group bacterium]